MRLLFLTGQVPYPPHAGGALRTFGLLNGLHKAGYTIDLMTFTEPGQPDPATTPLAEICEEVITAPAPRRSIPTRLRDLIFTGHADMARRFFSPFFEAALRAQLAYKHYDLIQIESLEMATYLPTIRTTRPAVRVIYDSFNAEFDLQRLIYEIDRRAPSRLPGALYSFVQWKRLTHFEKAVCEGVDRVIAVSDADADAFRQLVPGVAVDVVPNGIYAEEYTRSTQQLDLGSAALLFTGTMNYRPNIDAVIWFADNVLPDIRKAVPEARFFVVGNKPHNRLDGVRQRADVEVTGWVQDVLPFLHSAAVYVAPLRMGSGTRLKLLQAMAAKCAVVSTRLGAQGLNVTSGHELVLADDADSFARSTITLLRDPAQRVQLGEAARDLVCSAYDWSVIVPRLIKVYQVMGLTPPEDSGG
ncbi:MAG: glycosyltransferase [Anaerolineae bacterium]|nr:glycosyltransferase [Anaerolineae bacterium]